MARLDNDDELVTAFREDSDNEDDVIDDFRHNRLLQSIGSLDGKKKIHEVIRSEPARTVSEFHVTTTSDKVGLHELVGALKNTATHGELKKKLNRIRKKKKVVATPLPKVEQEKIKRVIAYEQTSTDVSKWDPIIQKNRTKDQITFPLQKPDIKLQTVEKVAKRITPFTSLELEVAAALQGDSAANLNNNVVFTEEEEKALKAMSLEEAKERRAELQKYRALLSYREAKARRQKKIKSKKFHRILRKEKDKKEKKRLEELEKSDPEKFLEELSRVDADRIQERMSLKHRGGSKFMKRQKLYAKYDDKARQSIQDMIDKNKELTRKMNVESSSDEEEETVAEETTEADPITPAHLLSSSNNPWLAAPGAAKVQKVASKPVAEKNTSQSEFSRPKAMKLAVSDDVKTRQQQQGKKGSNADADSAADSDAEAVDIDQLFDTLGEIEKTKIMEKKGPVAKKKEQNVKKQPKKGKKQQQPKSSGTKAGSIAEDIAASAAVIEEEDDEEISMSLSRKRTLEDMDDWPEEETKDTSAPVILSEKQDSQEKEPVSKPSTETDQIDPKKFLTLENKLKSSQIPDVVDDEDEEEQHRMTIGEAFASDDVVEEFNQEKRDLEDKEKVKDIDLTLPGWGEWGGAGVQPKKNKRSKFVIEAPKDQKRKDRNLGHVIISETKDTTITKHQVNKLPHYFRSVHQFESSIRAPIGKTWNPETSYRDLIKPKVVTEMGKIIDPISKSEVFKKQQVKGVHFAKDSQTKGNAVNNKRKAKTFSNAKRPRKK